MLNEQEKLIRDERLEVLTDAALNANKMDLGLYQKFDVKRGLRESNGRGVLTGLTEISDVNGRGRLTENQNLSKENYISRDIRSGNLSMEIEIKNSILRKRPTCFYSENFRIKMNFGSLYTCCHNTGNSPPNLCGMLS